MEIAVLNGSPKGNELSITMQYINYLKQMFPEIKFIELNVGQLLTNMRLQEKTYQHLLDQISSADAIIWSFPVYTTLIPAQLKKYIEILFEKKIQELSGKYAAVLSTSMKFYDHVAHNYMRAISEDLGMKYYGFFSANSFDLIEFEKRKQLYYFMKYFLEEIKGNGPISRKYPAMLKKDFNYIPGQVKEVDKIDNLDKRIIILTDYIDQESNEAKMAFHFNHCFENGAKIFNLNDINIKGACLGCLKCGLNNKCVYNDEFTDFFENYVKNTDILVYAGRLVDRFLSSRWKLYFDRCFYRGHIPSTEGTQLCVLISGELSQNENISQWVSAIAELGYANLVDIVTDESGDSETIDSLILNMARKAVKFSETRYVAPPTFLKEGGYKIFRDMLYGLPGAVFQKDFIFFKRRKMFDFPNKDYKSRITRWMLILLLKSKKARKMFEKQINTVLVKPLKGKLDDINFKEEKQHMN